MSRHDDRDEREDETVGDLLRRAGHRPAPTPAIEAALRATARGAWEDLLRQRTAARRRTTWTALAAAAALLVALGGTWLTLRDGSPETPVTATVATVTAIAAGDAGAPAIGDALAAGHRLTTGEGQHLALAMAGASVRFDGASEAILLGPGRLHLERGAVYVDAGDAAASLEVLTDHGTARDIGTQFAVRLLADGWSVQVREGAVAVTPRGATARTPLEIVAGELLVLDADGAVRLRDAIAADAAAWSWASAAAPAFDLDGRTVADFLRWVTRETGWAVRYADDDLAAHAETIVTHGSITALPPAEAVEVVLASSGLRARRDQGVLVVERIP